MSARPPLLRLFAISLPSVFDDLNMSFLPQTDIVTWDLERWAVVSQRKPASFSIAEDLDSPEERAILAALDDTVLEHNFSSAGINDWTRFYASVIVTPFQARSSAFNVVSPHSVLYLSDTLPLQLECTGYARLRALPHPLFELLKVP